MIENFFDVTVKNNQITLLFQNYKKLISRTQNKLKEKVLQYIKC